MNLIITVPVLKKMDPKVLGTTITTFQESLDCISKPLRQELKEKSVFIRSLTITDNNQRNKTSDKTA